MAKTLLTDEELVAHLNITGVTVRKIAFLRQRGKIPFIKLGYRTLLYDPTKVLQALQRREVKAVGQ